MNIYFAASIKGGRELQCDYQRQVTFLKRFGTVLTEHVAGASLTKDGEPLSARLIHDRDLELIDRSDLLIAEVTVPSLGVGYEIRYAIERGKRVVCLCRWEKRDALSAMIAGSNALTPCYYRDDDDLEQQLSALLTQS